MAAIANATGLATPPDGLAFPAAGMDDLAQVLRPGIGRWTAVSERPAQRSLGLGALPIGLAHGVKLEQNIGIGQIIRWQDVEVNDNVSAVQVRREMEARFRKG